jgi:hypothetical protein
MARTENSSSANLPGLLRFKCPVCHQGDLFIKKNPFSFSQMSAMHEKCDRCNADFQQEPGFYWGSFYVSYALTLGFSAIVFLALYLIWGWLTWEYLITNTLLMLLFLPLFIRYSRAIWLYLFMKHDS